MAREGLFNILNNILDYSDLSVLDLFAGTGSISYEFASRGARVVHAVEINPKHASFIRNTALKLGLDSIEVFRADSRRFTGKTINSYELIFADPPYKLPWLKDIPDLVMNSHCLEPGGLFILEHPEAYNFTANQYFSEHRKYGSVNFSFFSIPL
jgi:16S rRNA (guanine(966)-N(2))-methyltransferase RsmD